MGGTESVCFSGVRLSSAVVNPSRNDVDLLQSNLHCYNVRFARFTVIDMKEVKGPTASTWMILKDPIQGSEARPLLSAL